MRSAGAEEHKLELYLIKKRFIEKKKKKCFKVSF